LSAISIIAAVKTVRLADILLVIGTSLQVYPAAGLMNYAPAHCKIYYIDPQAGMLSSSRVITVAEKASTGVRKVVDELLNESQL